MTSLSPRRWYAGKYSGPALAWLYEDLDGTWLLVLGERAPFVGSDSSHAACPAVDVTGRSMAYVDRLAKDWICHGTSPTRSGSRGVQRPDRRERTPHGWRRSTSREALRRFDAAEARARRVVRP